MRRLRLGSLLPGGILIAGLLLLPQVTNALPSGPPAPSVGGGGGGPIHVVAREVETSLDHERVVALPITATHVAIHWQGSPTAALAVAFGNAAGQFGPEVPVELDEDGEAAGDGDTFGGVMWAEGARLVRITSDQPIERLTVEAIQSTGSASGGGDTSIQAAMTQSPVITRAQWGADESYRFDAAGHEHWPPSFNPLQKFFIHHTAGRNGDPNPTATVRAIYYYHAITRGWTDIGYNFLIDEAGHIYEGRHARDYAPGEVPTEEDLAGNVVRAGQVKGLNDGTMGIALLGTFETQQPTAAARAALIRLLAWESERHGIDPQGYGLYTNPVTGLQLNLFNISGHRDGQATACPGTAFYSTFPALRKDVAAKIASVSGPLVDHTSPSVSSLVSMATMPTGSHSISFGLIFSEPVKGLTRSDFTVSGTSTVWSVAGVTGSGAVYTVNLQGVHPTTGPLTLRLGKNNVSDLAGLPGPAIPAQASANFAVDHTAPSVALFPTVNLGASPAWVDVTITFDEPIRGLSPQDIVLGGTSNSATPWTTSAVVGSGAHYAVTITRSYPAGGKLTIYLPAGRVYDLAGNPSLKSNTLSISISGTVGLFTGPHWLHLL
jgi:N-acetylmuramoyl-L-alanine amidase/Bacterial Ig-like domain